MARTAEMTLLELMVLKDDISSVIEYIGKNENFQFQSKLKESSAGAGSAAGTDEASADALNIDSQFYDGLLKSKTVPLHAMKIEKKQQVLLPHIPS